MPKPATPLPPAPPTTPPSPPPGWHYSPLPPEDYVLATLDNCETRSILSMPSHADRSAWNLFWLSNPGLDVLPMSGSLWWRAYRPTLKLASNITRDVMLDDTLRRRLQEPPLRFAHWWAEQSADAFDTGQAAGPGWHATVLRRARLAARRRQPPAVAWRDGKLVIG